MTKALKEEKLIEIKKIETRGKWEEAKLNKLNLIVLSIMIPMLFMVAIWVAYK